MRREKKKGERRKKGEKEKRKREKRENGRERTRKKERKKKKRERETVGETLRPFIGSLRPSKSH